MWFVRHFGAHPGLLRPRVGPIWVVSNRGHAKPKLAGADVAVDLLLPDLRREVLHHLVLPQAALLEEVVGVVAGLEAGSLDKLRHDEEGSYERE